MPSHPSPKSVSFAPTTPEVRTIPDYMGTWAHGELCYTATDEQQNDDSIGERLARESYAMASAMIAQDAAGRGGGSLDYSSPLPACRSKPTPGLRSILKNSPQASDYTSARKTFQVRPPTPARGPVPRPVTNFSQHVRRKPIPARAQSTLEIQTPVSRPQLVRPATNHQFGDFLSPKHVSHADEGMQARRASLHPFEALATKGFHGAKKLGLKAKAMAEKKLVERKK